MENEYFSGKSFGATACALASALAFGVLVPFSKIELADLTPLQLAALLLLGGGAATGIALVLRKALGKSPANAQPLAPHASSLVVATLANAVALPCLVLGIAHMQAASASLTMGLEIAVATVCGWLLLRRHFCYKACAAVALICLAGVLLFWNEAQGVAFVPESLFVIAACILIGVIASLEKIMLDTDILLVVFIRNIVAGIAVLAVSLAIDGFPAIGFANLTSALLLGVVSCGASASMLLFAARSIGAARAESHYSLAPFFGMLVSWALFGLEIEPLFFGALAFMALGVWLAMDDGIFHETAYSQFDQELMALYEGDASAFRLDRLHRPIKQ